MSRVVQIGSLLMGCVLFCASCGDDEEEKEQPEVPVTCKSPYTKLTQAQLTAATTQGACEEDTVAICQNDVISSASQCGTGCFVQSMDPMEQGVCTMECLKQQVTPVPSDACLTCYIESVQCAAANCLEVCLRNGTSAECQNCRIENGCTSAFYACSGLPVPDLTNN